jgi:hypothetical protein
MSLRGVITTEELPANLVVVAPDLAQHAYAIESSQGHDRQGPTEADPQEQAGTQQRPVRAAPVARRSWYWFRLALVSLVAIGNARAPYRLAPKSANGKSRGVFWTTLSDDPFGTTNYLSFGRGGPMPTKVDAREGENPLFETPGFTVLVSKPTGTARSFGPFVT